MIGIRSLVCSAADDLAKRGRSETFLLGRRLRDGADAATDLHRRTGLRAVFAVAARGGRLRAPVCRGTDLGLHDAGTCAIEALQIEKGLPRLGRMRPPKSSLD